MARFRSTYWSGVIRTACMDCGNPGRHRVSHGRPEKGSAETPRLKTRPCAKCGGRHRPLWWVRRYPRRAAAEVQALALKNNPVLKHHLEGVEPLPREQLDRARHHQRVSP